MMSNAALLSVGPAPARLIGNFGGTSFVPSAYGARPGDLLVFCGMGGTNNFSTVPATAANIGNTYEKGGEFFSAGVLREARSVTQRAIGGSPGSSSIAGFRKSPTCAGLIVSISTDPRSLSAASVTIGGASLTRIGAGYYSPPSAGNVQADLYVWLAPRDYIDNTAIQSEAPTGTYGGADIRVYEINGAA